VEAAAPQTVMLHVVERVCGRVEALLGRGAVAGAARGSPNKTSIMALFINAPLGKHASPCLYASWPRRYRTAPGGWPLIGRL
jgi:hypothetical protein